MVQCWYVKMMNKITISRLIVFALIASLFFCSSGIDVKVINKSDRPMQNLKVIYRGGHFSKARLNVAEIWAFNMKVRGESNVDLEYEYSQTNRYHCFVGIYLGYDFQGTLDIKISNNGKLSYKFVDTYLFSNDLIAQKEIQCDKKED